MRTTHHARSHLRSHLGLLLLALAVAVPVAIACVVPRNLAQQVEMAGDEVCLGTVTGFSEVDLEDSSGGSFRWTVVDFAVEESYVTGQKEPLRFVMRGGIRPGSATTTITPSVEDIKVGRKLILFLAKRTFGDGALDRSVAYQLFSFAEVFRVEEISTRTGPRRIVLGQGPGFAFTTNTPLEDARVEIARALAQRKK